MSLITTENIIKYSLNTMIVKLCIEKKQHTNHKKAICVFYLIRLNSYRMTV